MNMAMRRAWPNSVNTINVKSHDWLLSLFYMSMYRVRTGGALQIFSFKNGHTGSNCFSEGDSDFRYW